VGSYSTPERAFGVAVDGSYAYVAAFAAGLRVVDVSNPIAPFEVGSFDLPGEAESVAVVGRYAFVTIRNDGPDLWVIDVSDPTAPFRVGSYGVPGVANDVEAAGKHVYVATSDGLWVLDVSNPEAPASVGGRQTQGRNAVGIAVDGEHVYIADLDTGLHVFSACGPFPRHDTEIPSWSQ
jgi:hypothetical protein